MGVRVLIADDHQIVRQGIRALLEREGLEVVADVPDGYEAVRDAERLQPDVAVLDVAMPRMNGIDAGRAIAQRVPGTRCLLLTMHADEHFVIEGLQAGVAGCVLKTQAAEHLVDAIHAVARGESYSSPSVSGPAVQAYLRGRPQPAEPLTPRERQVLQLVAEGRTTKEVAALLGMAVKTAESHRTHIMDKLDLHSTARLVQYAIRRGLVEP